MNVVKAGESHGSVIMGILTNVPSGIAVNKSALNSLLKERNVALGRSERQKIERDKINIITGVRNGLTLGNNVGVVIKNAVAKDYKQVMDPYCANVQSMQVTALRPAHADFAGVCRYNFTDARNVLEGASARNTCVDTALGGIAISMLEMLGIKIAVTVKALGVAKCDKEYSFDQLLKNKAPAFSQNKKFIGECKKQLQDCSLRGETLGGTVEIKVSPIKPGFGSYVAEKRVNALIAQYLCEIQAVKGVFFGQDPFNDINVINYVGKLQKGENGISVENSCTGGIDGGMTNGDYITVTVGIKPIPTTKVGVKSVDIQSGEECVSAKERSDLTAVFAICPVLKAKVALALTTVICERIGCDNMSAIIKRYNDL